MSFENKCLSLQPWRKDRRSHSVRKRLAFSKLGTSTTLMRKWKGKDVLPSVLIVGGFYPIATYIGCEPFF